MCEACGPTTDAPERVSHALMDNVRERNRQHAQERGMTYDDYLADPLSSGSSDVGSGLWSMLKRLFGHT